MSRESVTSVNTETALQERPGGRESVVHPAATTNHIRPRLDPSRTAAENLVAQTFLKARAIIHTTEAHIASVRQHAARHLRTLRRRARAGGFAAGERAGLQLVARHAVERNSLYRRTISAAERDCLEVALAVAREVIGADLTGDPSRLLPAIRREIDLLTPQGPINVKVHPSQAATVEEALTEEIAADLVTVCPDEDIWPGKCEFQTGGGSIYLDWEHTFDAVAGRCREKLRGSG